MNKLLKETMKKYSIQQWKVADLLGISEFTMARKMRYEIPLKEQKEIIKLIEKYVKENEGEKHD